MLPSHGEVAETDEELIARNLGRSAMVVPDLLSRRAAS
jgi:hypothetical protein